jgi:hypothetical protein
MLVFTKRSLVAACVAGSILTLAFGFVQYAQGCHGMGGRSGMGGYATGGMGGGYGGAMSGTTNASDVTQTPVAAASKFAIQNDPATALAYKNDLQLTDDQVQRLQTMLASGQKRAGIILTAAQKKTLQQLLGLGTSHARNRS